MRISGVPEYDLSHVIAGLFRSRMPLWLMNSQLVDIECFRFLSSLVETDEPTCAQAQTNEYTHYYLYHYYLSHYYLYHYYHSHYYLYH